MIRRGAGRGPGKHGPADRAHSAAPWEQPPSPHCGGLFGALSNPRTIVSHETVNWTHPRLGAHLTTPGITST